MLESPPHQSQSPGEIQLIQVFYRIIALGVPVLLSLHAHTGSSKGAKRQRSCDLGCHLPGASLDHPASVLLDANISLLLPLCSAAVQTPQWSLHMKLGEILHCRAVEETSTSASGWPGPTAKSFCLWWGFLLAKCSQHLEGWMLLSACGGREERCGDPRCFPSRGHSGVKEEKSCSSPQLESPRLW